MKTFYFYCEMLAKQTVMKLVKKWISDYNNVAPHSGLGMKSPVEYRKLVNQGQQGNQIYGCPLVS